LEGSVDGEPGKGGKKKAELIVKLISKSVVNFVGRGVFAEEKSMI